MTGILLCLSSAEEGPFFRFQNLHLIFFKRSSADARLLMKKNSTTTGMT